MALFKAIRNILLTAGQTSTIGGGVQILSTADQDSNGLNAIKLFNAAGTSKGYLGYRQNDVSGLEISGGNGSNTGTIQFGGNKIQFNTGGAESVSATFQDSVGLKLNGVIAPSYIAKTANFTATSLTSTIDCTNTITITLPTAVGQTAVEAISKSDGTFTLNLTSGIVWTVSAVDPATGLVASQTITPNNTSTNALTVTTS